MSDETRTKTPRHKTRDLRALQAEATKADADAKNARDQLADAKELYNKKLAEKRKKDAKAKRLAEKVKKAALRDAYERAGKALMSHLLGIEDDKIRLHRLPQWREYCMKTGMTAEMCDLIGLTLPADTPPPAAAEPGATPPPPAAAEPGATPPPVSATS